MKWNLFLVKTLQSSVSECCGLQAGRNEAFYLLPANKMMQSSQELLFGKSWVSRLPLPSHSTSRVWVSVISSKGAWQKKKKRKELEQNNSVSFCRHRMHIYAWKSCNYMICFLTSLKHEVGWAFCRMGLFWHNQAAFKCLWHVPELALLPVSLAQWATMRRNTALMFLFTQLLFTCLLFLAVHVVSQGSAATVSIKHSLGQWDRQTNKLLNQNQNQRLFYYVSSMRK